MKILTVAGARPNFVKVAPLLAELRRHPGVHSTLVHTGQHFDDAMAGCFLRDLRIQRPDFILSPIAADVDSPSEAMAEALAPVFRRVHPDAVLVVGDVNSTLAGALAAERQGIPVAHVEAGLRSFDFSMPEETNRIRTDALSSLLFASEPSAVQNLLAEGHPAERIFLAGNVMIDSLRRSEALARRSAILERLQLIEGRGVPQPYVLATLHRPAAVDSPEMLRGLLAAFDSISEHATVVFPVHPRTAARLGEMGVANGAQGSRSTAGIRFLPPLPYFDFLHLESRAALVITDSGGVQEETTALGVPCLTARKNTERPATLTEGTNQLVGLDPQKIVEAALRVLNGERRPCRVPRLWDGRASGRIVRILLRCLAARAASRSSGFLPASPRLHPLTAPLVAPHHPPGASSLNS
jgi:UDP-N-acetylglucosamine 2-epimerase (non-hydrolysing)